MTSTISDLNNGTTFQIVTSRRGRVVFSSESLTKTVDQYDQLVRSGECTAQVRPTCDIAPYRVRGQGRGFAVRFDGQPLVADDSLRDTLTRLNYLKNNGICRKLARRECRIIESQGEWALKIGGEDSVLFKDNSRSDVESVYSTLRSNGICR